MLEKCHLAALFLTLTAVVQAQDCTASGTVVDALTNQPIPHAQIAAESPDSRGAATDSDGNFTIPGLPCGHLRLIANASGVLSATLDTTAVRDLRIALTPESSLSGKVTDADGNPIPGVHTQPYVASLQNRVMPVAAPRDVDSTGGYRIPLPPATYSFCAQSTAVVYPIGGGGQLRYPETCYPVTIHPGEQAHLDITLTPVPTVHVRGSIAGLPPGVEAIVELRTAVGPFASPIVAQRASASQFDLSAVVPGDYTVQASAVGGEKSFFAIEDVTVGSGGVANLRLSALPSVSLTGAIRFVTASAQPRPNVTVRLFPDSGTLQWDAAGDTFTVSDVIPRKYRVSAYAGAAAYVRSMKFQNRDVLGKEFVLSAPGNLEIVVADDFGAVDGNVTDSDGNPVAAMVVLQGEGRSAIALRSGKDGKLAPQPVPPGHYIASVPDDQTFIQVGDPPTGSKEIDVPPLGSVSIALVKALTK
jgi:hypothetical protein